MAKGKRPPRLSVQFPPLDRKPIICIIGHSMPKRLFRAFDNESLFDGQAMKLADGQFTRGQMYAEYFYVADLIAEVHFFHSATVCSRQFLEAVHSASLLNPDIVLFHASGNDLAAKHCKVKVVYQKLMDQAYFLISEIGVSLVMFASVLKREDTPRNGKGRLLCSIEDYRLRAKFMNRLVKRECSNSYDMAYILLPSFWYDSNRKELPVSNWSKDRLHPGPKVGSEGFARYYNAIRHLLLRSVPLLGQARFMDRYS